MKNDNKYLVFFEKLHILTFDEFQKVDDFLLFSATQNSDQSITVKIQVLKSLSENELLILFKILEQKIIGINFKVDYQLAIDQESIKKYLKYFANHYLKGINTKLKNLLNTTYIEISNKVLKIYYLWDEELSELNKNEIILNNFFKDLGINFNGYLYLINKNKQEYEIEKNKKLELLTKQSDELKQKSCSLDYLYSSSSLRNITLLKNINLSLEKASVVGEIFDIEITTFKTGAKLYKFYITDHTSELIITSFAFKNQNAFKNKSKLTEDYLNNFTKGSWIKADIKIIEDKYLANEIVGQIYDINKVKCPNKFNRTDNAENKRTELLAHTKMSAFDGLCSASELIDRAIKNGWDAISIIDRYNVQSFPDAFNYAKQKPIKIIYGWEADALKRKIPLVLRDEDKLLQSESFVIFDLETTGLCNENEELIEFGAIKIRNGLVYDTIDFFIKPTKKLSNFIIQTTKITNEMLDKHGIEVKEALQKILNWIGDDTLIAHNAFSFDYRFLNKKLVQNGFSPLKNNIIDTLQVSRAINTEMVQHSLGTICRHYKIDYNEEEAHRADFDARVLSQCWQMMLNKLKSQGIINLNQLNSLQSESLYKRQFSNYLCVYAKNQNAIKNIYRLVSYSHTDYLFTNPRIFYDELDKYRSDFIITNSPTESELWDIAINGLDNQLEEAMKYYDYVFIASPNNYLNQIHNGYLTEEVVKIGINKIINTANKLNKKVIAVSDSYYLDQWDKQAHDVYVNSKILGGKSHRLFRFNSDNLVMPDLFVRTTQEMLDEFSFLKDKELIQKIVIDNVNEFKSKIESNIAPLKKGNYPPEIPDAEKKLLDLVYENAKNKYGDVLPDLIKERLDKEVNSIVSNKFSVIYWIAHLLVKKSNSDGYLVGSRGSVGSSLVAFLSNISDVNPLPPHYVCPKCKYVIFDNSVDDGYDLKHKLCPKCETPMDTDGHNIPFETFLGFYGDKTPDIDLNFSGEYQNEAHEFIRSMFPKNHTFRAGTISTIASKTAFGYIKTYFEKKYGEFNSVGTKAKIQYLISKCIDVKRTTGQHPGGIIVVPDEYEIFDFSPYNYPADDKLSNWYTTHFAFENIHDNLLKFDILGHDDPTMLRYLHQTTKVDPKTISFHDESVLEIFKSLEPLKIKPDDILGETIGTIAIPEFGTELVRSMLKATKPQSFADLIRISGLSHGTDVWLNNAQDLILKANMKINEVIACRDDIMINLLKHNIEPKISFEIMEDVRKGKQIKHNYIDKLKANNVAQWYIDSCNKIKYLFPKAHATAYVITAWRIAWYKVHYPLAFYAAYFSVRHEIFDIEILSKGIEAIKEKIINIRNDLNDKTKKGLVKQKDKELLPIYEVGLELYARGFKIIKPNLETSDATKFIINNNELICPFNKINGFGNSTAKSIVKARTEKPFSSKNDLTLRTNLSKAHIAELEKLGIIDHLKDSDQISFF